MTENKRFNKHIPDSCYTSCVVIIDNHTDKGFADIDDIVELLNELHEENQDLVTKKEDAEYELLHLKEKYEELLEENKQLKKTIAETERMVQSTHDELIRLRYIEKNLKRIKSQWDWIMEAI